MREKDYETILRILSVIASGAMLYISAGFSVEGFNIVVPEKGYMGWMLAVIIIIVQVVWNKVGSKAGVTLFVAGLLCYGYGIWTNVVGILHATEITKGSWEIATSILFGGFLEIVPEPLLVWALIGKASDPLSNLSSPGGDVSNTARVNKKRNKTSHKRPNYRPQEMRSDIFEVLPKL